MGKFHVRLLQILQAFDTGNHDILLKRTDHYGIRGNSKGWFISYLSNRCQFVSINGVNSDYKTIKYDVPWGSVPSPFPLLIFINDLNIAIKHSETFDFAEDTCILNNRDSVKQTNKVVNKDLKFLFQWLNVNRISLNIANTEIVVFRRNNNIVIWIENKT